MRIGSEITHAATAAVSLLVLLIGFTFSLALNRYDNRRDLGVEEAAAINATWERQQVLRLQPRVEMARTLRAYAGQRLAFFSYGIDTETQRRADEKSDLLLARLWVVVREQVASEKQPLFTRMLMDNLTRIDDAAWRREALSRAHIPLLVVELLVIFSMLTAASMGFSGPADRRVHPTQLIFFALNASAIMLVVDLDRPRSGLVQVSQRPMLELIELMNDDLAKWNMAGKATTPGPPAQ